MKKFVFLAIAAVFAVNTANAQFRFGVKLGMNVTSLSNIKQFTNAFGVPDVNIVPRVGLVAGVFAEYALNDKFALSADLLYSQQGSAIKEKQSNGKLTFRHDYLNIPILANYYIGSGFAVKAGIQLGFLLSADIYAIGAGKSDIDWKEALDTFDLSIPVGLSYSFPIGLIIDARYAFGITRVNKDMGADIKNLRNGVFSLSAGYRF